MLPLNPNDLVVFITIARYKNFTRAAKDLGVSPSALSHSLRVLEEKLDIRLLNRTTRSVALTEAGEILLDRIEPAFRDIGDALNDLSQMSGRPYGTFKINSGLPSSQLVLLPIIEKFIVENPGVKVEIGTSDALVDMVAEGFDAGVRFGESLAKDMIAVPMGPSMRSVVVASPSFFETHNHPDSPEELKDLPCIGQRFPSGQLYKWEFERGGVVLEFEPEGPIVLNDMRLVVDAAVRGVGIAFVLEGMAQQAIAEGNLHRVLEDWCPYFPGLYLYYPSRRQITFALQSFIKFLKTTNFDQI